MPSTSNERMPSRRCPAPHQAHARHARQAVDAVAGELRLVRGDRVAAQPLDVVERAGEADRAGDVGRAGLEAVRRLLEGRLLEGDGQDHVAAALERRHGVEQCPCAPTARRCRSAHRSCGRRRHRSRSRAPARRRASRGAAWQPSTSTWRAARVREARDRLDRHQRAGRVGELRHRDELGARAQQALERGHVEPAGRVDRRRHELRARCARGCSCHGTMLA